MVSTTLGHGIGQHKRAAAVKLNAHLTLSSRSSKSASSAASVAFSCTPPNASDSPPTQTTHSTHLIPRPCELLAVLARGAAYAQVRRAEGGRRLEGALDLLLHGVVWVRRHRAVVSVLVVGLWVMPRGRVLCVRRQPCDRRRV